MLSAVPPTQAVDSSANVALKTCPRCQMSFWLPNEVKCIGVDFAIVAPLLVSHLAEVCLTAKAMIGNFWVNSDGYLDLRKYSRDQVELDTDPDSMARGRVLSFKYNDRPIYIWTRRTIPRGLIYATGPAAEFPLDWSPGASCG